MPAPKSRGPTPGAPKTFHIRLQKVLARAGVASRRHAEELITAGRVRINGRVATELGVRADPRRDRVEVDGKRIVAEDRVYLVLHKPRGVVSTMADPEGRLSVRDYLKDAPGRVFPVGRLDYATSGVLLATNDGDFAEALLHPRRAVPKTYIVKVSGRMAEKDIDAWRTGVELEDGKTLPAKVSLLRHEDGKTWLELTIQEGRNQQIRRMGDVTGFPVMRLARSSFAGVTSEALRPGTWRPLTAAELVTLRKDYGVPKVLPATAEGGRPEGRPSRATSPSRGAPRGRAEERPPRSRAGSRGSVRAGRPNRSGPERAPDQGGSRGELGGRGRGFTRTTGTGGGIGANEDDGSFVLSRRRRR
jgi:23S rRNA pseudouridine2605 synthase